MHVFYLVFVYYQSSLQANYKAGPPIEDCFCPGALFSRLLLPGFLSPSTFSVTGRGLSLIIFEAYDSSQEQYTQFKVQYTGSQQLEAYLKHGLHRRAITHQVLLGHSGHGNGFSMPGPVVPAAHAGGEHRLVQQTATILSKAMHWYTHYTPRVLLQESNRRSQLWRKGNRIGSRSPEAAAQRQREGNRGSAQDSIIGISSFILLSMPCWPVRSSLLFRVLLLHSSCHPSPCLTLFPRSSVIGSALKWLPSPAAALCFHDTCFVERDNVKCIY